MNIVPGRSANANLQLASRLYPTQSSIRGSKISQLICMILSVETILKIFSAFGLKLSASLREEAEEVA